MKTIILTAALTLIVNAASAATATDPLYKRAWRTIGKCLGVQQVQQSTKQRGGKRDTKVRNVSTRKMRVCFTTYWSRGGKTDRWTANYQTPFSGIKLNPTIVAVDPKVIKYGSAIKMPDGKMKIAMDTGAWVKSRKASKRRGDPVPVVDVYFRDRKDAAKWARENPAFGYIEVITPQNPCPRKRFAMARSIVQNG